VPSFSFFPKVIVFDLNGVLVDWDGISPLISLAKGNLSEEQARCFYLESPWVKKFDMGLCSKNDFAAGVVDELKLETSPEEFLEQFITWHGIIFPGLSKLLDRLRNRFILACLSNNNELHWKSLTEKTDLAEKFDHIFLSFEMGLMKPAKEAFEHVIHISGYFAEDILFLDDNQEHVATARGLGFQAYQVSGEDGIVSILHSLKIEV
jgi:putative hydrolase of the HAD superfamily